MTIVFDIFIIIVIVILISNKNQKIIYKLKNKICFFKNEST